MCLSTSFPALLFPWMVFQISFAPCGILVVTDYCKFFGFLSIRFLGVVL